nr:MAG TPA: hypothetical protein [Caudoviricetes sp.]
MIRVLKEFFDLKAGQFRPVGSTFEATRERFEEINAILPGFVEWGKQKAEVVTNIELPEE